MLPLSLSPRRVQIQTAFPQVSLINLVNRTIPPEYARPSEKTKVNFVRCIRHRIKSFMDKLLWRNGRVICGTCHVERVQISSIHLTFVPLRSKIFRKPFPDQIKYHICHPALLLNPHKAVTGHRITTKHRAVTTATIGPFVIAT